MSIFDADELAGIRADLTETLTDQAYILRIADQKQVTAAGKPIGALSNGAGGIRQSLLPGVGDAPAPEYSSLPGPIPCLLSISPRGIGEFLVPGAGATQARTSYRLDLPYDTEVFDEDRIRVITDTDDFISEVTAVEPHSDQFTRAVKITRID